MCGRMRLILRVLVLAGMAGLGQGLAGVAVMAQTPRLRLRGGGLEALAVDESSPSTLAKQQTEKDPVKRKELFNTVPRMNHKEEWQKWKSDRFPKKSRGPIWRELRDFACGSVVKVSSRGPCALA